MELNIDYKYISEDATKYLQDYGNESLIDLDYRAKKAVKSFMKGWKGFGHKHCLGVTGKYSISSQTCFIQVEAESESEYITISFVYRSPIDGTEKSYICTLINEEQAVWVDSISF